MIGDRYDRKERFLALPSFGSEDPTIALYMPYAFYTTMECLPRVFKVSLCFHPKQATEEPLRVISSVVKESTRGVTGLIMREAGETISERTRRNQSSIELSFQLSYLNQLFKQKNPFTSSSR